jgi:hypothetical protein
LRDAAAFDALFLEALVLFEALVCFAAVRPRVFAWPRALEVLFFGDLAIHNSFDGGRS